MLDLPQASFRCNIPKDLFNLLHYYWRTMHKLNVHMLDLIHYFVCLIYCVNTRCICISNSAVYHYMHYYFIGNYLNWILEEILLINNKPKNVFIVSAILQLFNVSCIMVTGNLTSANEMDWSCALWYQTEGSPWGDRVMRPHSPRGLSLPGRLQP